MRRWGIAIVACGLLLAGAGPAAAQTLQQGFGGPVYPDDPGNGELSGEKPESKVWWNDGRWWGSLWKTTNPRSFRIWYLDPVTQQWVMTDTTLDPRADSRADVLWDDATQTLYVVSHVFDDEGTGAPQGDGGRLYRYSYDTQTKTYTPDAGFPVEINQAISETLVLAKDSTGRLWVTWVQDGTVMVNRSVGSDDQWGVPFVLPAGSTDVGDDDVSSIIAFDGQVGVMWSKQSGSPGERGMYFAAHPDAEDDTAGWTSRRVYSFSQDDHISLKTLVGHPAGQVFAAIKTSNSQRIISLVVCENGNGACTSADWTEYPVYRSQEVSAGYDPTRPILLIDTQSEELYVFTRNRLASSVRGVYYKKVPLADLNPSNAGPEGSAFPGGVGELFIGTTADINNPTSTKQNLTLETGLLVLAADGSAERYYYNYRPFTAPVAPTAEFSAAPVSGFAPLQVAFTDLSTGVPTTWSWDFGDGAGSIQRSPVHIYTQPGVYTVTLTAANAQGQDVETKTDEITVGELPPAGGGLITFEGTWTGVANTSTTVATTGVAGGTGELFLAAVSTRPERTVTAVSGLGLTWIRVRAQCSGRNATGVEVWLAHGLPTAGTVTATLASAAVSAVIAVSAYDGVASVGPVGAVVSGNSNGVAGACSGGTDTDGFTLDLTLNEPNAVVYTAAAMRNRTHTPGAGYTERAEVDAGSGGDVASVAAQDQLFAVAAPVVAEGAFSGAVDWAAVALEIRPDGSAALGPAAEFSANITAGEAPLEVSFTDLSTGAPSQWSWHFGDGGSSTAQNPTHTFAMPGIYTVSLTVSNEAGTNTTTKTEYISASLPEPVADFTASPRAGTAPVVVSFTDLSSGFPEAWAWEFGDGGTSTLQNPTHLYDTPGTYMVRLAVTNDAGEDAEEKTAYIEIAAPVVPDAEFVADVTTGDAPLVVEFTDLSAGPPTSWLWDFGDGSAGSTAQHPAHTYTTPGVYTVTLTATNALGQDAEVKTSYIAVTAPPVEPVADFTAEVTTGDAPLTVQFTDLSSGPPASWFWEFGDGSADSAQHPAHTYTAPGVYAVTLTVTNTAGQDAEVKTDYIVVTAPGGGGGVVTFEQGESGGASGSTSVATDGPIGATGNLFLAAVSSAPRRPVTGVAGLGLTWTPVAVQCGGRNTTGIEVWVAHGTPSGAGVVTAALASAATNAVIAVSAYGGVSPASPLGTIVQANTNGVSGTCTGGTDSNSYALPIAPVGSSARLYGAVTIRNRTHTPGADYTERIEVNAGGTSGSATTTAVQDRWMSPTGPTAIHGTLNSNTDWAFVGIEIRPNDGTPAGDFVADVTSGTAPLAVQFTDMSSGGPAAWTWDFGDGSEGSTAQSPSHTYAAPGTYTVTLTVTNAHGADSEVKTDYITVTPPPPVADFTAEVTTGDAPLTVQFTDLSSGPPASWFWEFGDGSADSAQHPAHTYTAPGVYAVTLTVTNTAGQDAEVKTDYIVVTAPGGGGGVVTFEQGESGGASGSTSVATDGPIGATGNLFLAAVSSAPRRPVTGVAGLGLTWTPVAVQCGGRNTTGIEVWVAHGTPSGAGVVTATFATAPSHSVIAVAAYDGAALDNPVGAVESANTNGASGACSGGSDSNSYAVDLPASGPGARVFGAATVRNRTHTPGVGYTERMEVNAGGATGTATTTAAQDRWVAPAGPTVIDGTSSGSTDWAVIGIEIRPEGAPPSPPVAKFGASTTAGDAPLAVQFTDESTSDPTEWSWDFGDGSAGSTAQHPGHTYTAPGTYTVTLTAVNAHGEDTATKTDYITVSEPPPAGDVTFEGAESGGSAGSPAVATSGAIGATGNLFVAAVSSTPRRGVSEVTGLGLTWTPVADQCGGRNTTGLEVWVAHGTPSEAGVVMATFTSAPSHGVIAVAAYAGAAPASPLGAVVSANTNGASGACTGGTDSNSYAVELTPSGPGALIVGAVTIRNRTHTPGAAYSERVEVNAGGSTGTATATAAQDRWVTTTGPVIIDGTLSHATDWAVVGLEIRPQ